MQWDVVEVRPAGHLALDVTFADGVRGKARFAEGALVGVFEALKDPAFFVRVKLGAGFVTWPGEIDLAPDAMYAEIKKTGEWRLQ